MFPGTGPLSGSRLGGGGGGGMYGGTQSIGKHGLWDTDPAVGGAIAGNAGNVGPGNFAIGFLL